MWAQRANVRFLQAVSPQATNAPPGLVLAQVSMPGGSHPSPASTTMLPQTGPTVVVVVVVEVDVEVVVLVVVLLEVDVLGGVVEVEVEDVEVGPKELVVTDEAVVVVVFTITGAAQVQSSLQSRPSQLVALRGDQVLNNVSFTHGHLRHSVATWACTRSSPRS